MDRKTEVINQYGTARNENICGKSPENAITNAARDAKKYKRAGPSLRDVGDVEMDVEEKNLAEGMETDGGDIVILDTENEEKDSQATRVIRVKKR